MKTAYLIALSLVLSSFNLKDGILSKTELIELNTEYIRLLNEERKGLDTNISVEFDVNMLYSTVLFNYEIYKKEDIYHSESFCDECFITAELCGYSTRDEYKDVKELAKDIYNNFKKSPEHHKRQMQWDLSYVSVSYIDNYYVVRLGALPHDVVDKKTKELFGKLVK